MSDKIDRLTAALADRYAIEHELGAGGMATVYLAHDVKHNRKVAVKVLRPELAAILGAERFLKEIEVTANLQHPHILPLFDSGEADSFLYYVMPLVEGESLRDKLSREKQLPVDEAVRIARAVADALQYAHERSVIHRDIKPENILLHSGNAMVADFGIALAVQQAGGNRMTETGLSLGTPQYMSPEQATADRAIDARSDVYSLGAVLYEMLAGDPPHTGSSAQAIIASVVTKEPEAVTERRPTAPQHVVDTVHIAIQKLPADRFATAGDMVTALDGNILSQYTAPRKAARGAQAPARRLLWPVLAALFAALAIFGWLRPRQEVADYPVRLSISLPSDARLAQEVDGYRLAISPDGQRVVYVGEGPSGRQLYVRDLGTIEVRPLPGTEGAYNPFFSPDGEWIAFAAAERIAKVATDGGPVSTVMSWPGGGQMYGGTWLENDTLVITQEIGQTLLKVAANGGEPLVMETADTLFWHWWPQVLPDNQHILVSLWPQTGSLVHVGVMSLETGELQVLEEDAMWARYVTTGHVVFVRSDGSVMGAPFDLERLEFTSPPVPVFEINFPFASGFAVELAIADNGTVAYIPPGGSDRTLVLVDRVGNETELVPARLPYESPKFSPDGRSLAVAIVAGPARDLWTLDLDAGTRSRLTFGNDNFYPVWTPDGQQIAFASRRTGGADIYVKSVGSSDSATALLINSEVVFPSSWTPDGRSLLYRQIEASTGFDLWQLDAVGDTPPTPLLQTRFNEAAPMLSPDGRWLAYISDESGRMDVYLRPYPEGGRQVQISTDGGTEPLWRRDGRELFYRRGTAFYAAELAFDPEPRVIRRQRLFEGSYYRNLRWTEYDVHPDGDRLLLAKTDDTDDRIMVVLDWFKELEGRVRGERQ